MATKRRNIGMNPYPTGRSPMAFDLSRTTDAISQRLVKREQQRIEEDKSEVSENMQMMLKALDFETVIGLSQKVQEEHLDNVSELHDKWAGVLSESGGKLSLQQKKDLMNDKLKVETTLGNMKADVETFKLVQEKMKDPNAWYYYTPETFERFRDYAENGKIGSGDALNIIEMRRPEMAEYISHRYKDGVNRLEKRFDTMMQSVNTEEGYLAAVRTNERAAESMWDAIKQDPEIQRHIAEEGEQAAKDKFMGMFSFSLLDEKFNRDLFRAGAGGSSGSYYSQKYGWDITDKSLLENMVVANDFAERIMRLDKGAMDELIGTNYPNFGIINEVSVDSSDGDYYLHFVSTPTKKGEVSEFSKKIPNRDDASAVKQFKRFIINLSKITGGKQDPSEIYKYIEADWDELTAETTTAPTSAYREFQSAFNDGRHNKVKSRKSLIEKAKALLPDVDIRYEKRQAVVYDDVEEEQDGRKVTVNKPIVKFQINTKAGWDNFAVWVDEQLNYEESMREKFSPRTGTVGVEDGEVKTMNGIPYRWDAKLNGWVEVDE